MNQAIRSGSILALLFAFGGASVFAEELRKAELLLCSDKTKECDPVAVFQTEVGCKSIVSEMEAWKTWEKLERLRRLQLEKCCPTPAPSATPTDAERKRDEALLKAGEDAKERASHLSYMCRPM